MNKKIAILFFVVLAIGFLMLLVPYTYHTELFTQNDIPERENSLNPDGLRQISHEQSDEALSMMQDLVDTSGTIILNLRYENLDDAKEDLEKYKNTLEEFDNMVVNLDMTKSEIAEFQNNNKEQLEDMEDLTRELEELNELKKLQIQYRDADEPEKYFSVTYDLEKQKGTVEEKKDDLQKSTDKKIESGKKIDLHTETLEETKNEIEHVGGKETTVATPTTPPTAGTSNPSTTGPSNPSSTGSSTPSSTAPSNPSTAGSSNPSTTGPSNPSTAGSSTPSTTAPSTPSTAGSSNPSTTEPSNSSTAGPSTPSTTGPSIGTSNNTSSDPLSDPSSSNSSDTSNESSTEPSPFTQTNFSRYLSTHSAIYDPTNVSDNLSKDPSADGSANSTATGAETHNEPGISGQNINTTAINQTDNVTYILTDNRSDNITGNNATGENTDSLFSLPEILLVFCLLAVAGYRYAAKKYGSGKFHSGTHDDKDSRSTSGSNVYTKWDRDRLSSIRNEYLELVSDGKEYEAFGFLAHTLFSLVSFREHVHYTPSMTNDEFLSKLSSTKTEYSSKVQSITEKNASQEDHHSTDRDISTKDLSFTDIDCSSEEQSITEKNASQENHSSTERDTSPKDQSSTDSQPSHDNEYSTGKPSPAEIIRPFIDLYEMVVYSGKGTTDDKNMLYDIYTELMDLYLERDA